MVEPYRTLSFDARFAVVVTEHTLAATFAAFEISERLFQMSQSANKRSVPANLHARAVPALTCFSWSRGKFKLGFLYGQV